MRLSVLIYLNLEHEVDESVSAFRYAVKGGERQDRHLSFPLSFASRDSDAATLEGETIRKKWSSCFWTEKIVDGDVGWTKGEYLQVVALMLVRDGRILFPF